MLQYAVVFDFYLRVKAVLVLTSFPSCEVQVLLSNGAYRHLNLPDLRGLFAIREMWLFFIFVVGILATGHPITLPQLDGFGGQYQIRCASGLATARLGPRSI